MPSGQAHADSFGHIQYLVLPFVFPVGTFPEGGEKERQGLKLSLVPVCERSEEMQTFQPLCVQMVLCMLVCVCVFEWVNMEAHQSNA